MVEAKSLARTAKPSWWTLLRWSEFMWFGKKILLTVTRNNEKRISF